MPDNSLYVTVGRLKNLPNPMDHFDVWIPAEFTEDCGAIQRLVRKCIELTECRLTRDFSHEKPSPSIPRRRLHRDQRPKYPKSRIIDAIWLVADAVRHVYR